MSFDYKQFSVTEGMIERSVVARGNLARLVRVMRKAQRGEKTVIAIIGGSITQGANASDPNLCYASRVRDWWMNAFPNAEIEFHNAGVGGTQSILGVHRVEGDVLRYNPDFSMVEFAVNDHVVDWETEAYSNLCRRIYTHPSAPALMLLFMINWDYNNAQEPEIEVGNHYRLPMISYRDAIKPEFESKHFLWEDIVSDYVHPNDKGHAMVGAVICNQLQWVLDNIDSIDDIEPEIPEPYVSDIYSNATLLKYDDVEPIDWGSFSYKEEIERPWLTYKKYWHSEGGDEPIIFNITGGRIFLMYDGGTTANHKISVSIDGEDRFTIEEATLDAGSAALYKIFDGEAEEHTVAVYCDEGVFDMKGILIS